jgi:O-6-methylguanine DNA methyltransferase
MVERIYISILPSPVGPLSLVSTSGGLAGIGFGKRDQRFERWVARTFPGADRLPASGAHAEYARQIEEYFEGRRRIFDLTLDIRGSSFQKAVWVEVSRIPFGRTASYTDIAHLAGNPRAVRAVGAANGANPIPLVIPCHRVLGADGSLTGFGGGLGMKRWLLAHEGALRTEPRQMSLFRPPSVASGP